MAARGVRWIRLALYIVGALALAAVAVVFGLGKGKGKTAARPDAARPVAKQVQPHSNDSDAVKPKDAVDATGKPFARRERLKPNVRQPGNPPDWSKFDAPDNDDYDMNLE